MKYSPEFSKKIIFQISSKDIYFQSGIYCCKRNFLLGANLYWGGGKSAKTGKRLVSSLNLLLKFREKYLLMYTNISILNQYVSETYCLLISANVIYENVTIIFNISFKPFFDLTRWRTLPYICLHTRKWKHAWFLFFVLDYFFIQFLPDFNSSVQNVADGKAT